MADLIDPIEPPEGSDFLKAKDFKNKPVILQPVRFATEAGRIEGKEWTFVECNVWELDRAGVVQEAENVRVSWWRAVAQLKDHIGSYIACRPVEQEDNSIILAPLTGDARDVAARVVKDLSNAVPPSGSDDEPF